MRGGGRDYRVCVVGGITVRGMGKREVAVWGGYKLTARGNVATIY